jgi:hypothetical protein
MEVIRVKFGSGILPIWLLKLGHIVNFIILKTTVFKMTCLHALTPMAPNKTITMAGFDNDGSSDSFTTVSGLCQQNQLGDLRQFNNVVL